MGLIMSDLVLVTGISGFLGGHVALALLEAGYRVRGSVRDLKKAASVKETIARAGGDVSRLEFVALDLGSDAGWQDAMEGVRFLQHVASPFVIAMPKDKNELIRPAVEGTQRALNAALKAEVERVILTSSMVSIWSGHDGARTTPFNSADWTRLDAPDVNAYSESKTRAERRAWEIMEQAGRKQDLATINPAVIFGPLLDEDPGTSGALILRLINGSLPAAPRILFPGVDVRDVAEAHVKAMQAPDAGGKRFPMAAETLSLFEIGRALKAALPQPDIRTPRFEAPDWMVHLLALTDREARSTLPELGLRREVDASAAEALLGRKLRSTRDAAIATARSLVDQGLRRAA